MKMTLPSFLCIGAQKAGTSWLFIQLRKHPDIWMPPIKELHFFDHLYVEQNRIWIKRHIRHGVLTALTKHLAEHQDKNIKSENMQLDWPYLKYLVDMTVHQPFTDAWYARCFNRPQAKKRLCGDITPEYSTIPEEGIEHIKKLIPNVKIFYIIRDPVERALSQIRMNIERRRVNPDESILLKICDEWDIDNRGDYMTYIPRWQKNIDEKNLLILPYGNMKKDGKSFMRQIEDFLGVFNFDGYDFITKIHETKKFTIPESVITKLTERYMPQREFIEKTFGQEFLLNTH